MQECTFGDFLHDLQVRGSINCAYDDILAEFAFTQERMRDELLLPL
jgi:hypothetical protein